MDVVLAQGQEQTEGSLLLPLLMIAGLFAVFYFMLIRPNKRRRQQMEKMQAELAIGDEVMTTSGLYGTVADLDEKTVILETSEGVYSRYARGAILEVINSARDEDTSDSDAEADTTTESREGKD